MGTGIRDMRDIVTFDWPRNPFPGLRPFREDEALIFYGRNSHKDEVLARLNNSQLVFVTGPSGCGKSSLIKAGVLRGQTHIPTNCIRCEVEPRRPR
jgi:hypothetical protein